MSNPLFTKNPPHKLTKYSPEIVHTILNMMADGKSKVQVCAALMISTETLSEWLNDDDKPELKEAMSIGLTLSEAFWENKGQEAIDSTRNFRENTYKLLMANRFKWGDKTETTIKDDKQKQSPEELSAQIEIYLQKRKEHE